MARYVYEIMSPEVMSIAPEHPIHELHRDIMALGTTAVPVVGEDGAPLGVASLRDLLAHPSAQTAEETMSKPAIVVDQCLEIETADGATHSLWTRDEDATHVTPATRTGARAVGSPS